MAEGSSQAVQAYLQLNGVVWKLLDDGTLSLLLAGALCSSPLVAAESSASGQQQGLRIAVHQGLHEIYKDDLKNMTSVLVEQPAGMFINGHSDGILTLESLDDLGMGYVSEKQGGRPFALVVGVWLPDVALGSEDDKEEERDSEKTYLDEETVLRQAYSGQIAGSQQVRLYLLDRHHQRVAQDRLLGAFIAYPPEDDEDAQAVKADTEEKADVTAIVRPADATTEQNRPVEIREYDSGLLVLPSPQMMQANAVTLGVAVPVYVGGYR